MHYDYAGADMTDLLAARAQMAMSLAFHIVFAVAGIAMPFMMAIAEAAWLWTGDESYRDVARHWSKGNKHEDTKTERHKERPL